jgi:hypothetical protein
MVLLPFALGCSPQLGGIDPLPEWPLWLCEAPRAEEGKVIIGPAWPVNKHANGLVSYHYCFPHSAFFEALEHIKTVEEVDISSTIWCIELSASEF